MPFALPILLLLELSCSSVACDGNDEAGASKGPKKVAEGVEVADGGQQVSRGATNQVRARECVSTGSDINHRLSGRERVLCVARAPSIDLVRRLAAIKWATGRGTSKAKASCWRG